MKEENARKSTSRVMEYSAIVIFLMIILIILVPSVSKIVYNMSKDASVSNTKGTIDMVKSFYVDMNLTNEVGLPFKVVFDKNGYTFYENGKKVNYKRQLNIKNQGKLPKAGSVTINVDGTVSVKDLTFGNFKCNQTNDQNLVCDNKW